MHDESISRWGYIDRSGKIVIGLGFDHASQFNEGFALVLSGGFRGFIDKSGDFIIQPQFGNESQLFFEGLAMVEAMTGKCGFIDRSGHFVIEPIFDWAGPYRQGFAVVKVGGKYGYINRNGTFLLEPKLEHAGEFSQHLANICKEDGSSWLSGDG